ITLATEAALAFDWRFHRATLCPERQRGVPSSPTLLTVPLELIDQILHRSSGDGVLSSHAKVLFSDHEERNSLNGRSDECSGEFLLVDAVLGEELIQSLDLHSSCTLCQVSKFGPKRVPVVGGRHQLGKPAHSAGV